MAREYDPYNIEKPNSYLIIMVIFLIIVAFATLILYQQIITAYFANVGLNSIIGMVLLIGIFLSFAQILRLYPEINWVNTYRIDRAAVAVKRGPKLLAPMATLLGDASNQSNISTQGMRSILDSIGQRLDEGRDTSRYLIGLLVFLGLLGTFWGLLQTVNAVGSTIQALDVGSGDSSLIFEDLKTGLEAPLTGMGTAFSSSLFGLSGSLILGFLDLQSGHAQNRFYNNLEDWLSTFTDLSGDLSDLKNASSPAEFATAIERLARVVQQGNRASENASELNTTATSELAEGIQGLVQNMRSEQQLVRNWMEAQSDQQGEIKKFLETLSKKS
ncbi:MAG: flagellar motor protein MotA [Hyphomicrobiales bacterium]